MLDGSSLIDYSIYIINIIYNPYLIGILIFVVIAPILVNGIILYYIELIERKDEINIPKLWFLTNIFNRFFTNLKKIVDNKEVLKYYKEKCNREILFYLIILFFILFLLYVF
jgi:hypothetical protein